MNSGSTSDAPVSTPLGGKESVGHAAADRELVHARDEMGEDLDLGRDLGAADNGHDRPRRIVERAASASTSAISGSPA